MTDVACDTGGWVPSTPGGERASPAASPMKPPSASSRSRASSAVTPDARSADRPSPRREDDDGVGASIANWFSGVFGGDKDEGSKVEDEDDAAEEKTPPSPRDGRREKRSPNEDDDDHDHDRDRGDDANAASDATATDAATSTSALPSAAPAADVALAKFRADVAVALAIARDALPRRVARNAQLVASLEDLKTFADRDAVLAMADWRVAGGGEDLDAVQVADVKVVVEKEEEEGETLTAVPLEEETTTTDAKTVGQSWPIRLQLPGLVELAHEDEPGTLSSWTYCDAAAFAVSASAFGGGGGGRGGAAAADDVAAVRLAVRQVGADSCFAVVVGDEKRARKTTKTLTETCGMRSRHVVVVPPNARPTAGGGGGDDDDGGGDDDEPPPRPTNEVRSILHWSPCDRVRVVNAVS